jgi:hypothetical protein
VREPEEILKNGTRVVTSAHLESTRGLLVVTHRLEMRRPNVRGTIAGWVAGHGGDVYWVRHDGDDANIVAPYGWGEFELEPVPVTDAEWRREIGIAPEKSWRP